VLFGIYLAPFVVLGLVVKLLPALPRPAARRHHVRR
jgi:hypothetical protein